MLVDLGLELQVLALVAVFEEPDAAGEHAQAPRVEDGHAPLVTEGISCDPVRRAADRRLQEPRRGEEPVVADGLVVAAVLQLAEAGRGRPAQQRRPALDAQLAVEPGRRRTTRRPGGCSPSYEGRLGRVGHDAPVASVDVRRGRRAGTDPVSAIDVGARRCAGPSCGSTAPKKKMRSRRIGPPISTPGVVQPRARDVDRIGAALRDDRREGRLRAGRAARTRRRCRGSSFAPLLVTTLTTPPVAWPNSAS